MLKAKNINFFQAFALIFWVVYIFAYQQYPDFNKNLFMSITMIFGSMVAGATSEGGGAIAFPVMTLLYKIPPYVARDFSLFIQSFGMTAALFTMRKNKLSISKYFLITALTGGIIGQVLGLLYLESLITPTLLKISYTSLWMSFAFVLWLHLKKEPNTRTDIKVTKKNIVLLIFFSLFGGILTSLTGNGIDIVTFSLATLYFGIEEKVATRTSVCLMALSSIIGVALRLLTTPQHQLAPLALDYWLVCLPVVIFGAPLGALFITQKSRKFVIHLLITSIVIQFIFSWWILPLTLVMKLLSIFIILTGLLGFTILRKIKPS